MNGKLPNERLQGLPPIAAADARVLILGSFPSEASLRAQQYYAHPRNQFWHIMQCLFGMARSDPYAQRCRQLVAHQIALWDVIKQCQRQGSLDRKIRHPQGHDFAEFYAQHPQIMALFWNGAAAEQQYRALVGLANKPLGGDSFTAVRLPSSSPAHATLSLRGKVQQWQVLRDTWAAGAKNCAR